MMNAQKCNNISATMCNLQHKLKAQSGDDEEPRIVNGYEPETRPWMVHLQGPIV